MAEKNNQDLYDNDSADSAMVENAAAAVRHLLAKGKKQGYITMEELNKVLPPETMTSEKIEDIMSEISDMGINIISDSEEAESADSAQYYDDEAEDENAEDVGNIDIKDLSHSDDPVRMYLK